MKVFLREILPGAEGKTVEFVLTADEMELPTDGFQVLSPFAVTARLNKESSSVSVEAGVTARYLFSCARCLSEVEQQRTVTFDFAIETTPDTEFIELTNDIREEMIIAVSPIVVCQDDCKGLCPSCGKNLNHESCSCGEKKK